MLSLGVDVANGFARFFQTGHSGDVGAARAFALGLLSEVEAAPSVLHPSGLLLTAACLHLQGRIGCPPTASDMVDLLETLAETGVEIFGRSSMQLVQFAAAELSDLSPSVRADVVGACLRAISLYPA